MTNRGLGRSSGMSKLSQGMASLFNASSFEHQTALEGGKTKFFYRSWHWCQILENNVQSHNKKFKNRATRAFRENVRFVRSNGRKTTFGWPKVVSEVSFPRFWGVICIAQCFCFFVSVIGSAVSKISRFVRFI